MPSKTCVLVPLRYDLNVCDVGRMSRETTQGAGHGETSPEGRAIDRTRGGRDTEEPDVGEESVGTKTGG